MDTENMDYTNDPANDSVCDENDPGQVYKGFQDSESVETAHMLLLSSQQKRVGLNKYVGETKLNVISEINSCIENQIITLQQKVAEHEKSAEHLITTDLRIDTYETRRLKEKAKNTSEIITVLYEVFDNLTIKTKQRQQNVADLTKELESVQTLMAKEMNLRKHLVELREKRISQQSENEVIEVNPQIMAKNQELIQEMTRKTEELAQLRSANDELKAFASNIDEKKAILKQLEEKSIIFNAQLEEKTGQLVKQRDEMLQAEESLNQRLNETLVQKQATNEKYVELLSSIEENKKKLSKQSEQVHSHEKELEEMKAIFKEAKNQSESVEQQYKKELEECKENVHRVENEYNEKMVQTKDLEMQIHSLKEEYLSLIIAKHEAAVANLQAQNFALQQQKEYGQLNIQNELIKEKLHRSQAVLDAIKLKDQNFANELTGKGALFDNLEFESEQRFKKLRADHEMIINNLQQRKEYVVASGNFLDEKLKNITETKNELKRKTQDLEDKENLEKTAYEAKQQKLKVLKEKFENDKKLLNKLKHEKSTFGKNKKSSVNEAKDRQGAASTPVSILKSPKAPKAPKTPPKNVKFLGISSSGSESDFVISPGTKNVTELQDPFQELLKALEGKNSSAPNIPSNKKKLDF